MSEMVRKQIYLDKRHQLLLKQLSQIRGISEAAVIRQAIEREAALSTSRTEPRDRSAWKEVLQFVESRKALGARGEGYQWNRRDAYEEREGRYEDSGDPRVE